MIMSKTTCMATSKHNRAASSSDILFKSPNEDTVTYRPGPARGGDNDAAIILDGEWGTPPRRDVHKMHNVTPGAPPDAAVDRSLICAAGFEKCYWADTPAHFHVGGRDPAILSPACSSCATLVGPFDRLGRCADCANGRAVLEHPA